MQRTLDVAEQDDALLVGGVGGVVDEGLVEQDGFAVLPEVALAVDLDVAVGRVRRDQAQVVAHRARVRVAVAHQRALGRQRREHRALDRRDAVEQRHRARARGVGRGQLGAVPLQVEALPARTEERVEAHVGVAVGHADAPRFVEAQRLGADLFPVRLQRRQVGEGGGGRVRRELHAREQHHQHVEGRQQHGVVRERLHQAEAGAPAQVHEQGGAHQQHEDADTDRDGVRRMSHGCATPRRRNIGRNRVFCRDRAALSSTVSSS